MLVVGLTIASFSTPAVGLAAPVERIQPATGDLFTPIPSASAKATTAKAGTGLMGAQLSYAQATGKVRFMRLDDAQVTQLAADLAPQVSALQASVGGNTARATAQAFLQRYGAVFGVSDAIGQLQLQAQQTDALGMTHLRYQQVHRGLNVFAGELNVHLNSVGQVQVINGVVLPDLAVNVTPSIATSVAERVALEAVRKIPSAEPKQRNPDALTDDPAIDQAPAKPAVGLLSLIIRNVRLYVYRTELSADKPGQTYLAYEIEVVDSFAQSVREFVYVDAHTGKVIDRVNAIEDALDRKVYNQSISVPNLLWAEGNALPFSGATFTQTLNANSIITATGHAYHFFQNAFGRDSFDAAGATMFAVATAPLTCPNANWNSTTTNFCDGVTSDDVVAHEWGHAYTEKTHGLIYAWQPGALNEAYSDIWGETIDRLNSFATDSPDVARTDNMCSMYQLGGPIVTVSAPITITGAYAAGSATFGPKPGPFGVTNTVVMAVPAEGCTALTNAANIAGKIALIDRGTCAFTVKALNAQAAGAIGVIIANNQIGGPPGMSGTDATVTIPIVSLLQSVSIAIKAELTNGEVVTANLRNQTTGIDNSYRWLMGEDSTAFGGAIRDMWNPTCYGHAGKVSDAQYTCTTGDAGGVHSNSGIPNHAYALLVDGGTYNGQTITGTGLTKAAHIYWRAQTIYQTSITDFADHADALEQSCTDLIGQQLNALSTNDTGAGVSGQTISATDCQQLSAVLTAVEMRSEPTQCAFQPMLAKNPPDVCAMGTSPVTLYRDTFEANPAATWAITTTMVDNSTLLPTPIVWTWTNTATLPGGRTGAAFFADNAIDNGYTCVPGADVSRQMLLTSPAITLTTGMSHVLTFDHYVASEATYDGGLLFISVNGGAFTQVSGANFTFNPYNGLLNGASSTNPRVNASAFNGADGGKVTGSWGQSRVNLASYASAGNVIQLRWNFATDGCGGAMGWWVDQPTVLYCVAADHVDLAVSDDTLDIHQTIAVTATMRDVQNNPLAGVNLTGSITSTLLGTVGLFSATNVSGYAVSTFTAGSLAGMGMLMVGNGTITGTLPITIPGDCLATPDSGTTVFETIDASAVQQAVNIATVGAVVKVAGNCAGVQTVAGLTQTVYISQSLLLMGGYTRSNWISSYPISNPTVLDAQKMGRVVYGAGVPIAIANVSLVNGDIDTDGGGVYGPRVTLQKVTLSNNTAGENGGAVYATDKVTLVSSVFISNSAGSHGGAVYASTDALLLKTNLISNVATLSGGAVEVVGTITATTAWFESNRTETGGGGGIRLNDNSESARMIISDSTFIDNHAESAYGGAIDIDNSNAILISNSSFSANVAQDGGAVDSDSLSPMLVQNSIFTANIASAYEGGALWVDGDLTVRGSRFTGNRAALQGGALANWGDQLVISQSQFITNLATSGGALLFVGDSANLANNLFAHNVATNTVGHALQLDVAGEVQVLHNTIVSGTMANGSAIYVRNGHAGITNTIVASYSIGISQTASGRVTAQYNVFDHVTISHTSTGGGAFTVNNNLVGDAGFVNAPLGDYHLRPHALAIERGTVTGVMDDFEGQLRPQQVAADIGMDESPYALDADLAIDVQVSPAVALPGQWVTYTLVFSNTGPDWVTDAVITDTWPVELSDVISSTSPGLVIASNQSWRMPMFDVGTQGAITISGRISAALVSSMSPLIITNTATITSTIDNINTTNNSSAAALSIVLPAANISDASVMEGNSGQKTLVFTATLTPANPYVTTTLTYATQDGTADSTDFVAISGTLQFTPGQTTQVLTVAVIGDTAIENDEAFTLTLAGAPGVILADGVGVGGITNDDTGTAISGLSLGSDSPTVLGDATTFTASVSAGSDVTYTWDFGDGSSVASSSSGSNSHVYDAAGHYAAVVTASNALGSVSSTTAVTVSVPVVPPTAPSGLSIAGPGSGKVGQQLTFTATLLVGTNISFTWRVSNTLVSGDAPEQPTLTTQVFRYTFASVGNYTVTVKASNSAGNIEFGVPILIAPAAPTIVPRMYIPLIRR